MSKINELPGTGRIEAFSDGVIAIIITIMVLELKIPEHAIEGNLWADFIRPLAPKLIAYALSFLIVAIYWVNHHQMMHSVPHATPRLMWTNNNLLFWLSLMPVATAFLGEHPFEPRAVAAYGVLGFMCGNSFSLVRWGLAKDARDPLRRKHHYDAAKRSSMYSLVYLSGAALGFVPPLALLCFCIPALVYFLPRREL